MMENSGKRKLDESNYSEIREEKVAKQRTLGEKAQSSLSESSKLKPKEEDVGSDEAEKIIKYILVTLPPIHQWSSATIRKLKFAVNQKCPKAKWQDESAWTRRVIDAILESNEGWNWQRLKTCSNDDFFSLPTYIIKLLNDLFHANCFDIVKTRCDASHFHDAYNLISNVTNQDGMIGYPIFRVDYSSDANFELYKTYWDQIMEQTFYMPKSVDREKILWYWVDDKTKLEGKGPHEVQKLFQSLCGTSTFPYRSNSILVCLMVNRAAIESMLRVYGPPAVEVWQLPPRRRWDIPFLPYLTAVDTFWSDEEDESKASGSEEIDGEAKQEPRINDREYHGYFKCTVASVFELLQNEQGLSPQEYYPRDGGIWGDILVVYYPPTIIN